VLAWATFRFTTIGERPSNTDTRCATRCRSCFCHDTCATTCPTAHSHRTRCDADAERAHLRWVAHPTYTQGTPAKQPTSTTDPSILANFGITRVLGQRQGSYRLRATAGLQLLRLCCTSRQPAAAPATAVAGVPCHELLPTAVRLVRRWVWNGDRF
jgi:hypothetical protein